MAFRLQPVAASLLLFAAIGCSAQKPRTPNAASEAREVKVMVVVFSDSGDTPGDWTFEGRDWAQHLKLDRRVPVVGLRIPIYCTEQNVCVLVTGEGPIATAASLTAAGLSPALDLRRTYFVFSGIAGTNPAIASVGSVAWIRAVIDSDNCHDVDARELPAGVPYSRFGLFCETPPCEPQTAWGGMYLTNDLLRTQALEWTSSVELLDSEKLRKVRARYPHLPRATRPPAVLSCDSLSGASFWHGKLLSDWATWWANGWMQGDGNYCMTDMEDYAALSALARLQQAGRVDAARALVVRAGANYDQPGEGETVLDSLLRGSDGPTAAANAYRVASVVIDHLVADWLRWRDAAQVTPAGTPLRVETNAE